VTVNLDGTGRAEVNTGIGFFDPCSRLLSKHSLIDLNLKAEGDLHVDSHHTVEDVGICLGKALMQALGDKSRHSSLRERHAFPMDEVLVTSAVDFKWPAFLRLASSGSVGDAGRLQRPARRGILASGGN